MIDTQTENIFIEQMLIDERILQRKNQTSILFSGLENISDGKMNIRTDGRIDLLTDRLTERRTFVIIT